MKVLTWKGTAQALARPQEAPAAEEEKRTAPHRGAALLYVWMAAYGSSTPAVTGALLSALWI